MISQAPNSTIRIAETAFDIALIAATPIPDQSVLPASPEAFYEAQKCGIKTIDWEQVLSPQDEFALSNEITQRIQTILEEIWRPVAHLFEPSVDPFLLLYRDFKLLLESAVLRTRILLRLMESGSVKELQIPNVPDISGGNRFFLETNDPLWSWIAQCVAHSKGMPLLISDSTSKYCAPSRKPVWSTVRHRLSPIALDFLTALDSFRDRRGAKLLIYVDEGRSWMAWTVLRKYNFNLMQWSDVVKKYRHEVSIPVFPTPSVEEFKDLFIFDGVDLSPLVLPRLKDFFVRTFPLMLTNDLVAKKAFRELKPWAILNPVGAWVPERRIINLAAKDAGIESVLYQHGGSYGYLYSDYIRQVEGRGHERFWCYGRGVSDELSAEAFSKDVQYVPVGSLPISTLRAKALTMTALRKKLLKLRLGLPLHVPLVFWCHTTRYGSLRYLGTGGTYPTIWYSKVKDNVADILRSWPEPYHIVVRPYFESAEQMTCRHLLPEQRTTILSKWPGPIALSLADIVITDSPSTIMLQAISVNAPVIAFSPKAYNPIRTAPLSLLKKRALVAETEDEYYNLLRDAGSIQQCKELIYNEDFMKEFAIHDSRVIENMVDDLGSLYSGKRFS